MANKSIYQRTAVTNAGDIIPGAEYTVVNERTGLSLDIFSSRAGAAKSSPYFSDDDGLIQFWTDPGELFRVLATGPSGTYTDRYVEAFQLTESTTDSEPGRALKVGDDVTAVMSGVGPGAGEVPPLKEKSPQAPIWIPGPITRPRYRPDISNTRQRL